MPSKKFLILAVLVSVFVHALVLSLTGLIKMNGARQEQEPLIVDLEETVEETKPKPAPSLPAAAHAATSAASTGTSPTLREKTVALESPDTPYTPYLLKIKQRINRQWVYPPEASSRGQQGETVIRFSISAGGLLAETAVLSSSGSFLLDRAALDVIRQTAPFGPLPPESQLDLLHIVARFQYRLEK